MKIFTRSGSHRCICRHRIHGLRRRRLCGGTSGAAKKDVPVVGDPAAPKEAALTYKLGEKDVPLYMYTGELPKDIHADISTASICK